MSEETKPVNLWSFSRITSHEQCPLQYSMKYIDGFEDEGNGWSMLGSFCHEILEMYARKELAKEDLAEYYIENYPDPEFPKMGKTDLGIKYRDECLAFFQNFKGFTTQVVGVERSFTLPIDEHNALRGFIDLETFDGENYSNIDYKISNPFKGADLIKKRRQLYLYSRSTQETFGKYPKFLYFYFIKSNSYIRMPFIMSEYEEAWDWVKTKIKEISNAETHQAKPELFYCRNLCGFRNSCPSAA
jgi:hypothetical protein